MIILKNDKLKQGIDYDVVNVDIAYSADISRIYYDENFQRLKKGKIAYVDFHNIKFVEGEDNGKCEVIESEGYRQGEYIQVIIPVEKLEKAWGSVVNLSELKDQIDQFLWNTPIDGRIEINGKDISTCDYDIDPFGDWENEREKLIIGLNKDYKGINWSELIPEKLEYN